MERNTSARTDNWTNKQQQIEQAEDTLLYPFKKLGLQQK